MTLPMTEAQIRLEIPRGWLLTANQRLHWAIKANYSRNLRTLAWVAARNARQAPFDRQQLCTVTIDWPDRRRRDAHNIMPTIKACIDGIVDAHVLEDDSDKHLVGPDLRVSDQLCDRQYAAVLHITFEPAEAGPYDPPNDPLGRSPW